MEVIKEYPILFKPDMVKAILEGRKTQTRRPMTPNNSTVNGDPGTRYDWNKFCWDGSAIYKEECLHPRCNHNHETLALLPWIDGNAKEYFQYLHVPYNWSKEGTIFRIRPKWEVGDRLWVRETHCPLIYEHQPPEVVYKASYNYTEESEECMRELGYRWKPSIHMLKTYTRLRLEITEIRGERVQNISEDDAIAEGVEKRMYRVGHIGQTYNDYSTKYNYCKFTAKESFATLWDSINAKRGYGWDANRFNWAYTFKDITNVPLDKDNT